MTRIYEINLTEEEIKELKECLCYYHDECLSQDSDKEFRKSEKILNRVYEKLKKKVDD